MPKRNYKTRDFSSKDLFVHNLRIFSEPIENPFKSVVSESAHLITGFNIHDNIYFNTNSLGYRCDEFRTEHDGKHILFSGCSVTHGIGLSGTELWSYKLFDKIAKEEKVSGYFNLATSGMGIMHIVSNIYKYIEQFGKPDCIFLNIPDTHGIYLYDKETGEYFYTQFDFQGDSKEYENAGRPKFILSESFSVIAYEYLKMFEAYCKASNIFLSYVSWFKNPELVNNSDLKNLYRYTNSEMENYLSEYMDKNPSDENIALARDKKHPGTGPHFAWSEMLYNVYKERFGVDK